MDFVVGAAFKHLTLICLIGLTKYYGENPNVWVNADKKFRQLARKIYKT